MRKKIAAANWKMNMTFRDAETLLNGILSARVILDPHQQVIFAVPFLYLIMTRSEVEDETNYFAAAQNCHHKKSGAFTGEISAEMLHSIGVTYCIVGHSERREYFNETNSILAEKINSCLENDIIPIFCCGEPLHVREAGNQHVHVSQQIKESLFHLDSDKMQKLIIAYEPVWAIGTGKTATAAQAQDMHTFIRSVLAGQYGSGLAGEIPVLYGGSVKAGNAAELFACPDVDGALVGGASLAADEFIRIIKSLK